VILWLPECRIKWPVATKGHYNFALFNVRAPQRLVLDSDSFRRRCLLNLAGIVRRKTPFPRAMLRSMPTKSAAWLRASERRFSPRQKLGKTGENIEDQDTHKILFG